MVSLSDTTAGRAAVLGSPVGHSLSPVLHQAAYRALNLNGWRYDAYQVDEAALPAFLSGLSPEAGRWAGLSLTMPLKRAVIPLLDQISDTAASVEAVNTVVFHPDGRRLGENTDIPGMLAALRDRGVATVSSAAVLGAGATASSALAALAQICSGEVTSYVRSVARAEALSRTAHRLGIRLRTADFSRATVECGWTPRLPYEDYGRLVLRVMDAGGAIRVSGSGTLALAEVACGRLDGYMERRIHLWDVAAALCVLGEAGAAVSPFLSGAGAGEDAPILAAAPGIAQTFAALMPFDIPGWVRADTRS